MATTTGEANFALVRERGADTVIDDRKDDVEAVLHKYDVVLHSRDARTPEASLRVLKSEEQSSRSPGRPIPYSRPRSARPGPSGRSFSC